MLLPSWRACAKRHVARHAGPCRAVSVGSVMICCVVSPRRTEPCYQASPTCSGAAADVQGEQEELLNLLEKKTNTDRTGPQLQAVVFFSFLVFFLLLRQKLATPKGTAAVEPVLNPEACAFCLCNSTTPVSSNLVLNPSMLSAHEFSAVTSSLQPSEPVPSRNHARVLEPVLNPRSMCFLPVRVQLNYARVFEPMCSTTAVHLLKYKQHDLELLHKL